MRTHLLAALPLFLAFVAPSQAAKFTAAEQEAAVTARGYQELVQRRMNDCASQVVPARRGELQFLWQVWDKQNEALVKAAAQVWATIPEGERSASSRPMSSTLPASLRPAEPTPARRSERCDALARDIQSGALDVAVIHPAATRLLARIAAARPEAKTAARNTGFTLDCMKHEWGKGAGGAPRDAASSVRAACECQTGVVARSGSEEEIDEGFRLLAAARGNEEAAAQSSPWLQKTLPALAACRPKK